MKTGSHRLSQSQEFVVMNSPYFSLPGVVFKCSNYFTLHSIYRCVHKLPQDLTTPNNTYVFYILIKCHQEIMVCS